MLEDQNFKIGFIRLVLNETKEELLNYRSTFGLK